MFQALFGLTGLWGPVTITSVSYLRISPGLRKYRESIPRGDRNYKGPNPIERRVTKLGSSPKSSENATHFYKA